MRFKNKLDGAITNTISLEIVCQVFILFFRNEFLFQVGLSYIELDKPVPPETLSLVEERCNSAIQDAIPVSVKLFQIGDPELDAVNIIRGAINKYNETIAIFLFGKMFFCFCMVDIKKEYIYIKK